MDHDWVRPLALNVALFAITAAALAHVGWRKTMASVRFAILTLSWMCALVIVGMFVRYG